MSKPFITNEPVLLRKEKDFHDDLVFLAYSNEEIKYENDVPIMDKHHKYIYT
jgi:hypothetical protein